MDTRRYDLVVLGSGPAGEKGAAQAAFFGKRVALVEKQAAYGGAACNTGTLPSKTLRETALVLSGFRSRKLHGVDLSLRRQASVADLMHHEQQVTGCEQDRIRSNLDRHGVDVFHGAGRFLDPHTVEVAGGPTLTADVVLLATGSSPRRPALYPFADDRVWDSDQILNLTFIPKHMVVVGAGVIGAEYASTFAALGTEVLLIDGREDFLGFLDDEMSRRLRAGMEALGVKFVQPRNVVACDAGARLTVTLDDGQVVSTEAVLVAAGRTSNIETLNLGAADVEVDDRGRVLVNPWYQTSAPHVYAAGDVIGFPALASTSMEQARVAMVHAFDLGYKQALAPVLPFGIYTIPETSMAGASEEDLKRDGVDYVVGRARYDQNPRGTIIGDDGLLKLIFRRSDMRLLGVHVLGENASELVHVGLMGLLTESTGDLFIRACFNYPTLGDLFKYATYDAMGQRAKGSS